MTNIEVKVVLQIEDNGAVLYGDCYLGRIEEVAIECWIAPDVERLNGQVFASGESCAEAIYRAWAASEAEVDKALQIVAAHALANYASEIADWEDFPEIGEHDWERLVDKMRELAPYPDGKATLDALTLLGGRVENDD